jgi:DDE_Tnp_1-associated
MVATTRVGLIKKHFRSLGDPRVKGRTRHHLSDIIVMALCAIIANCDDWHDIALFVRQQGDWFKRLLQFCGDVPSHDTFERVFTALDPQSLQCCCLAWLQQVAGMVGLGQTAIDGKTTRGSADAPQGALRAHWAIENRLHCQLDTSSDEDASRAENRHGAANLALLRELAFSLLKQHPKKESMARKRKLAALCPDFLAETLSGGQLPPLGPTA